MLKKSMEHEVKLSVVRFAANPGPLELKPQHAVAAVGMKDPSA